MTKRTRGQSIDMGAACVLGRPMRTGSLAAEFCPSCLGHELLTIGCRVLTADPDDTAAGYLVTYGAILARLPCTTSAALLPDDIASWRAELPAAAAPHVERIVATAVEFAVMQAESDIKGG